MRYFFLVSTLLVISFSCSAESLEEFKSRIESAYQQNARTEAVKSLFYQQDLNDEMAAMLEQTVQRISEQDKVNVSFLPLPDDKKLVAVVDGYEYRPNLEVIGYVDIGENSMGGTTRAPYGKAPDGKYYFTATTKKLVNAGAEPDKQIQMIAIGMGNPQITFEGWCDILLSNNETSRRKLHDQGVGNQTLVMYGQKIQKCQLTNTSERGSLSLRLLSDKDLVFEKRIQAPDNMIIYNESSR